MKSGGLQSKLKDKQTLKTFACCAIFFFIMVALTGIYTLAGSETMDVGEVASADIQATRYMTVEDKTATRAKEELALSDFHDIYTLDLEAFNENTLMELSNFFANLEKIILLENTEELSEEAFLQDKLNKLNVLCPNITQEECKELLTYDRDKIEHMHSLAIGILSDVMINSGGVTNDDLGMALGQIVELVYATTNGAEESVLVQALTSVQYYPTFVYDAQKTEFARETILDTVTPVYRTVLKGEMIVSKGEIITQEQYDILYLLGYSEDEQPFTIVLGLGLVILLMMILVSLYLKFFHANIYKDIRQLQLLMIIVAATVGLCELIMSISVSPSNDKADLIGYMLPTAMGTMLIATLLSSRLAILMSGIFAVFVGLITGGINFMIVSALNGIIGVLGISRITQRVDLSKISLWIALGNTIAIIGLGLISKSSFDFIVLGIIYGLLNGIFSAVFTLGCLPFLENGFGVTTSIKLLELSSPNNPLLKRLMQEAPGTYHHSVLVGNLGEAAAEAIGANELVVRVGAYYHDIGKSKRPYFFTENQFSAQNPHDKISPYLSTLILTSHVKDGVEMAKEAKLPPIIIDMIAQHHGNSLVSFFYQKAQENGEEVREEDFRYGQQKPQTKEAAILMMVDTVEAAVRSKTDATPGQIEGFIRTLIKAKLNDNQFDECDLTFKDLDKIAQAFVRVVTGIYHKRIEYPDANKILAKKNEQKGKNEKEKGIKIKEYKSNKNRRKKDSDGNNHK